MPDGLYPCLLKFISDLAPLVWTEPLLASMKSCTGHGQQRAARITFFHREEAMSILSRTNLCRAAAICEFAPARRRCGCTAVAAAAVRGDHRAAVCHCLPLR
jgi:hypothetical protein